MLVALLKFLNVSKNTKQIQYGVYLAYKPIFLASGGFESFIVYIINYCHYNIELIYEHKIKNDAHFKVNTSIGSQDYYELGVVSSEDCNETQNIVLDITINEKNISINKKVQPKLFFNAFTNIPFVEKEGLVIAIYQNKKGKKQPELKPVTLKDIKNIRAQLMGGNTIPSKTKLSIAADVVDLHWKNIKEKDPNANKDDIFGHQIHVFEKALDVSIAEGKTSVTFIHGIGSGKLKNAIFAYLESHPCVSSYSNDYDPRYGYGATKVLLKTK